MKAEWVEDRIYEGIEFSKEALKYFDDYRDSFDVSIPAEEIAKRFEDQEAEHHTWMLEAHLKRGELESELAASEAKVAVMTEAVQSVDDMLASCIVERMELREALVKLLELSHGENFEKWPYDAIKKAEKALSAAPKVLCVAEAWAYHKPHHGWQLSIKRGGADGIDKVTAMDQYDWPSFEPTSSHVATIYVLADDKPQEREE